MGDRVRREFAPKLMEEIDGSSIERGACLLEQEAFISQLSPIAGITLDSRFRVSPPATGKAGSDVVIQVHF